MVANLIAAFKGRIDRLDWMARPPRGGQGQACVPQVGVGYPDTWPDYSGSRSREDAYGNAERARCSSTSARSTGWAGR